MEQFWNKVFLENTMKEWAVFAGSIAVALILIRIFRVWLLVRFRKKAAMTSTTIDDIIVRVIDVSLLPLAYVLVVYYGLRTLTLSTKAETVIQRGVLVVAVFFVIRLITNLIRYIFHSAIARENHAAREKQANGILMIIQVVFWFAGLLFIIDNFGYNITTIIAGLGIGGIAIALAAQTILGDLFNYLVIFFDKPFEIGDFIIVGDKMGSVEYIGIKTTRLRALSGEQLVCSNTDLTSSRIHNYKRMAERRVVFSFSIMHTTPVEKLKTLPASIKEIILSIKNTRFDRAHLQSFSGANLNYEVVYYFLSPDYNGFMDTQQTINLRLVELFEHEEINFAFPAQKIYLDSNGIADISANLHSLQER